LLRAGSECGCSLRIYCVESGEAGAETGGVQLRDGEDADAALSAAWSAFEIRAGAARGVGHGGVDNLDEMFVAPCFLGGGHGIRLMEWGDD
jgi:hypothetical protein